MNKKLLVLGASSEIGTALIQAVHPEFQLIVAHYHSSPAGLLSLKDELGDKLCLFQADFESEESTRKLDADIQAVCGFPTQIVLLPANKITHERFSKVGWEQTQKQLNIQLRSAWILLQSFLPKMVKNQYGRVLFLLTSCTLNIPPKFLSDYITAKYAMLGLMKALAAEYAEKGICINAVSPSMIETKFLKNVSHLIIEQSADDNPLKRNASVHDVIPMMKLLLSDDSSFVTGQNIAVTGGED